MNDGMMVDSVMIEKRGVKAIVADVVEGCVMELIAKPEMILMLLLFVSATYTFPPESTAIP